MAWEGLEPAVIITILCFSPAKVPKQEHLCSQEHRRSLLVPTAPGLILSQDLDTLGTLLLARQFSQQDPRQVLLQSRLSYLLLQAVSLASLQPLSYLFPARMITGIQVLLLCVCLPCHRVDLWEEGSWLILTHPLQPLSRALAPNEDGAAFPKSLALTSYTPELCLHGTQSSVKETKRQ